MSTPPDRLSDEQLITAVQGDDPEAFEILVGRYKDPLTNFVYRMVSDIDECNDIVQETFIRAYRSRKSFAPVARFSTWIYTIAINLTRSHVRRLKVRGFLSFRRRGESDPVLDIPDESNSPETQVDSAMKAERIQLALKRLPAKFREVVLLRDVQELSYEEIVAISGLPMGTVKSRINRGRAMLQEMLKDLVNE